MAGGQAELIYVGGPQSGQRAALMSAVVTVGRGQQADVQLTEEHISRKHFQLVLTQDGWIFENLSPLRSRVNGKKYKIGKKIILDTGDVIAVGAETELLFVSAGDDPEAALIAFRQSGVRKGKSLAAASAPAAAPSPAEQSPETDEQNARAGKSSPAVQLDGDEEDVELTDEELAAQAQRAKLKKYAVIFAAYMGLLGVFVVILVSLGGGKDRVIGSDGRAIFLDDQRIDEFINSPFSRDRNAVAAREALEKAILALEWTNKVDHQYRGIYWFKVSRAYGRVLTSEEDKQFIAVKKRFTKQVQDLYRNAYAFQRDHQYVTSERIYRELLDMLPAVERRDGIRDLRQNIIAHVSFITRAAAGDNRR
jgi:predicted component of type VI protein secretion system